MPNTVRIYSEKKSESQIIGVNPCRAEVRFMSAIGPGSCRYWGLRGVEERPVNPPATGHTMFKALAAGRRPLTPATGCLCVRDSAPDHARRRR